MKSIIGMLNHIKLNKMATLEDVFYLYERNKLFYKKQKRIFEKNDPVQPVIIGDTSVPCSLSVKCYIRQGEECPICLENIMLKKDAFLTGCGHSFHRKCLFKMFENKWNQRLFSTLKCPMCRCVLGVPTLLERYKINYQKQINHLDELENFWFTKDYEMPHYCTNTKCNIHYLGMKPSCYRCKHFIEKGQ